MATCSLIVHKIIASADDNTTGRSCVITIALHVTLWKSGFAIRHTWTLTHTCMCACRRPKLGTRGTHQMEQEGNYPRATLPVKQVCTRPCTVDGHPWNHSLRHSWLNLADVLEEPFGTSQRALKTNSCSRDTPSSGTRRHPKRKPRWGLLKSLWIIIPAMGGTLPRRHSLRRRCFLRLRPSSWQT